MKPIAVFQHSPLVGPGHFASFLDARKLPWQHIRIDQGATVPDSAAPFAGLCFMGGEMSVNDELPWITQELALIREAVALDIPVIGHCLGGQLMAKALGGTVTRNPQREIGWGRVELAVNATARHWLGELSDFDSFHWHNETFTLPAAAVPLFSSAFCANQAFALGPHLGMQCHVEMTESLITSWAAEWSHDLAVEPTSPAPVQSRSALLAELPSKLPAMRAVAEHLYERWLLNVHTK
ncbi:type 1 glutamine amidotransferase [Uliginosibacterium aquaticum]|uniref:Type 1 glutamine amidotransferase n=1 Tax=Uliginosibacterium aquaticum TaxID=2731212 RepID=A0ABX2IIZ1_9RHOO|nr:type 1 glutamine amidotransferase [Uliginosibacterium aquaticum]NSL56759.1 type 1 glutamine amidotransferase [Uliginosibacterium aquaticum]